MSDPDPPRDRTSGSRAKRALVVAAFVVALAAQWCAAWGQGAGGPTTASTTPISTSGQPIDPTKNVLDTLQAAVTRLNDIIASYIKRQDDLREVEARFQTSLREAETRRVNDLREAEIRRNNDMRDAETKRIDQLAVQKSIADLELARVNKASVDSSALLLATAVKELKTDSSDRTAKLEQFANEQRGRASGGNEVWALIGVIIAVLLTAIGVLANIMLKARVPAPVLAAHNYPPPNGYPPPPRSGDSTAV